MIFQAVSSSTEEDTVVLYNTESDRKRLVERFVEDGLATGQELIFYAIKSEVPFYRAILKGTTTDHSRQKSPQMMIQSIDFGIGQALSDLAVPPGLLFGPTTFASLSIMPRSEEHTSELQS